MKIVFAVENDNGWESKVSSRFGRAEAFMLYTEEDNKLTFHSNTENVNAGHGAGTQASLSVINLKADSVITGGSMGPKAFDVLKKGEVKMYSQAGDITIKEALENFKAGKYQALENAD